MTKRHLTEADRAAIAADLLRESEQRQRVRLGRWTVSELMHGQVAHEDVGEGLTCIIRRAEAERTPDALRELGTALGQLVEVGVVTAEKSDDILARFSHQAALGAFPLGQADVRRPRPQRGAGGVARRRPKPGPSLHGWSLRELANGRVSSEQAEVAFARIVGRLGKGSTTADLARQAHAAGQLAGLANTEKMAAALEAAGRRAGLRSPGPVVRAGLLAGLTDVDRAA